MNLNKLFSKVANLCFECMKDQLAELVEHYLKKACSPDDCHACEKKLDDQPTDGPKDE